MCIRDRYEDYKTGISFLSVKTKSGEPSYVLCPHSLLAGRGLNFLINSASCDVAFRQNSLTITCFIVLSFMSRCSSVTHSHVMSSGDIVA